MTHMIVLGKGLKFMSRKNINNLSQDCGMICHGNNISLWSITPRLQLLLKNHIGRCHLESVYISSLRLYPLNTFLSKKVLPPDVRRGGRTFNINVFILVTAGTLNFH